MGIINAHRTNTETKTHISEKSIRWCRFWCSCKIISLYRRMIIRVLKLFLLCSVAINLVQSLVYCQHSKKIDMKVSTKMQTICKLSPVSRSVSKLILPEICTILHCSIPDKLYEKESGEDRVKRVWNSAKNLIQPRKPKPTMRRNDPWWMRDNEKNNPRILPEYRPWWVYSYECVGKSWTLSKLQQTAKYRGVCSDGSKKELLARLRNTESANDLHDRNFYAPSYMDAPLDRLDGCYPEVYDTGIVRP